MQQKLCSRGSSSFQLLERNGQASGAGAQPAPELPFRCPRCGGDRESFPSLASLRAHLERRHSYRTPDPEPGAGGFSITGKHPSSSPADADAAAVPWSDVRLPSHRGQQSARRAFHIRSLSDSRDGGYLPSYGCERRRTQSVGVGTQAEEEEEEEDTEDEEGCDEEQEVEEGHGGANEEMLFSKMCEPSLLHLHFPPPAPRGTPPEPESVEKSPYSGLEAAAASAAVRRRLASLLRAADTTMQRRLARLSSELAQTDTELLCERAHSQHLAQQRQEVAERERWLSRQVDVAVMVIAALREQLNASENELERREREVLTIQKFLEAAARQETCGKVRIQRFIENLLRRIALAERLVQYYRGDGSPPNGNAHKHHQQQTDSGPHLITKSRSVGTQLFSSSLHDNRSHSPSQHSGCPMFCKPPRERGRGRDRDRRDHRDHRERPAPASRLFCRPEHRDDIWNQQRRRSAGYEA